MQKRFETSFNCKTVSEANSSEHWSAKHKRHKAQKKRIKLVFMIDRPIINLPCKVKISRISPRMLDEGDNLPCSLKYIRDAISENILVSVGEYKNTKDIKAGTVDDDPRLQWEYSQIKGKVREYMVKIEIFY